MRTEGMSAKFTIRGAIILAVFLLNALLWRSPFLGMLLLVVWSLVFGEDLGARAMPGWSRGMRRITGVWILLSGIAIVGSLVYYFFAFTRPVAVGVMLLFTAAAWCVGRNTQDTKTDAGAKSVIARIRTIPIGVWGSAACAVVLLLVTLLLVLPHATEEATRSLWERIPTAAILAAFAGSAALTGALLLRGKGRVASLPLAACLLGVVIALALAVFPLGYGFDPFIHQATERHIAAHGTITPKPLYYVGQYAVVLFLHHTFALPIDATDRFLVPLLTVLFLPLIWYAAATRLLGSRRAGAASLLVLFLFPLDAFISTTPQGLANLWTCLTLLVALPRLREGRAWPLWPVLLGTGATLLIHPLAGIPIGLFCLLMVGEDKRLRKRFPRGMQIGQWLVVLGGCVALPLSFLLNAKLSGSAVQFDPSGLLPGRFLETLSWQAPLETRFDPLADAVYLFARNRTWLLILGATAGWIAFRRRLGRGLDAYVLTAFALLVNFLLVKGTLRFDFLIGYEQSAYADRLVPLCLFFLIPPLLFGFEAVRRRLETKPLVLHTCVVALFAALATANFYLTYPRQDAYATSHGYTMGQSDVDAVRSIDAEAAGTPYVALANQTVSAAAIREFGFAHYYDDLFFYPIPTGGPLYRIFLAMNEHPDPTTAAEAMNLAGTDLVYFVVNRYWWQADRIMETAKTNADDWWSVGDGDVYVFTYVRERPE
ncbi:hypothetical protein HY734_03270 [Candidatus Uhrbacteria bacterium]|nr:hypothetical protein [Candidatus Uhrbacteria bacterium]